MDQYKNVIYIIVDAFSYKNINKKIGDMEITPFLNQLSNQSTSFSNLYSQAPYTEACQVTLLSGENTLDHGGYLLGNANTKETLFSHFQKCGYKTIFSYSPYIYSKSYLKDTDEFFYTRLYSINPLLLYRIEYYKNKYKDNGLMNQEWKVCEILLHEAFETWIKQMESILSDQEESKLLIELFIKSKHKIRVIKDAVSDEYKTFKRNPPTYIENVFGKWMNHNLIYWNEQYNERKENIVRANLDEKYREKLNAFQNRYLKAIRHQPFDMKYVFGMLCKNKYAWQDFKGTVRSYKRLYKNKYLSEYLDHIDENAKVEASMYEMFKAFGKRIRDYDRKGIHYFSYIHVQDFHLPSVFHTVDTEDKRLLEDEFSLAFKLLEKIDHSYRGNIISDLSARFCDSKLEHFFQQMSQDLNNPFLFVVTADHGFPSFENPPRPKIYNQTYTEAFHVPCIAYHSTGGKKHHYHELYSSLDMIDFLLMESGICKKQPLKSRKFFLGEYGGPGCPDIGEKPIWYTLMKDNFRISVECILDKDISAEDIVSIHELEKDPDQKYDLVKRMAKDKRILEYLQIISVRHKQLRENFGKGQFYSEILKDFNEINPQ